MKEFTAIICTRPDGESFLLRRTMDDYWLCPVCAERASGEAPYDQLALYGSQDICPRCNTQYGYDDVAFGTDTVQSKWKKLRFNWLAKEGWPDDALIRLNKDLGIDLCILRRDAELYYKTNKHV